MEETRSRIRLFLDNDDAIQKYALKLSFKTGQQVAVDRLRTSMGKFLADSITAESLQEQFASTLERWIGYFDEHLYHGQWSVIHSSEENPFVIGDNPVATWKLDNGQPSFGVGFHVPGAEVFLPISPTACLHVLPAGNQRPTVSRPTPMQVNEAQVMFMTRRVYSKSCMSSIDEFMQRKGGVLQMGYNCFLPSRNPEADVERILMSV